MNIPRLKGTIRRRILVNFLADADVVQRVLPAPFRPKLYRGEAVVGVCCIRLEHVRPASIPLPIGISSENAAHRIAVLWDDDCGQREGVFIPRRDTGSFLNHFTGGRIFPGEHELADFRVSATKSAIDFTMESRDGTVRVRFAGTVEGALPQDSKFTSLDAASEFFASGCDGYSVCRESEKLDGLQLSTKNWRVEALHATDVHSSYFMNHSVFPAGSVRYDHALLMRDVQHEWRALQQLEAGSRVQVGT